jgi:hypothetical protein
MVVQTRMGSWQGRKDFQGRRNAAVRCFLHEPFATPEKVFVLTACTSSKETRGLARLVTRSTDPKRSGALRRTRDDDPGTTRAVNAEPTRCRPKAERGREGLLVPALGASDIDTATPMGSMLLTTMAAPAPMSHNIKRMRMVDSTIKWREADKGLGRQSPEVADSSFLSVVQLVESRILTAQGTPDLGLARATLDRGSRPPAHRQNELRVGWRARKRRWPAVGGQGVGVGTSFDPIARVADPTPQARSPSRLRRRARDAEPAAVRCGVLQAAIS